MATTATSFLPLATARAAENPKRHWPSGCFNRPWTGKNWGYDVALEGIKSAATS